VGAGLKNKDKRKNVLLAHLRGLLAATLSSLMNFKALFQALGEGGTKIYQYSKQFRHFFLFQNNQTKSACPQQSIEVSLIFAWKTNGGGLSISCRLRKLHLSIQVGQHKWELRLPTPCALGGGGLSSPCLPTTPPPPQTNSKLYVSGVS